MQARLAAAAGPDPVWSERAREAEAALQDLGPPAGCGDLDLSIDSSVEVPDQVQPVLDALELGLARVGCIRHMGLNHMGWDTHADNTALQTAHFETLFADLEIILADMDAGPAGGRTAVG